MPPLSPPNRATVEWLRVAIDRVWGDSSYRRAIRGCSRPLPYPVAGPAPADVVDQVISTGLLVL